MARKWILWILGILLAALGLFFGYQYLQGLRMEHYSGQILHGITVEAGTDRVQVRDFLADPSLNTELHLEMNGVDLDKPGEYPVTVVHEGYSFQRILTVKDTVAPVGKSCNCIFFLEPEPKPEDFLVSVQDVTDVTVSFVKAPDLTVAGDQEIFLVLTDTSGNTTELKAVLTVILDTQPPEISGVQDMIFYQGDTVAYRSGITVTDDMDPEPILTIDSDAVDLSTPGTYTLVYTASDASGNTATSEATITVHEKKEGYADLETIYARADELLATFIDDSMDDEAKVRAVYRWISGHVVYSDSSDKSDWLQGAYQAMTRYSGDCFNFFAAGKLFFERLGIPNIDVQKLRTYEWESNHYWSLVSVDGGQNWYHFDTTPRPGTDDYFCLVTDRYLDWYSANHYNCFNRDKSLYPATPEK